MTPASENELLDARGVALLLGLTRWSIYKIGRQMPHVRIGRSLRWRRKDVDAFVRAHVVPAQVSARY